MSRKPNIDNLKQIWVDEETCITINRFKASATEAERRIRDDEADEVVKIAEGMAKAYRNTHARFADGCMAVAERLRERIKARRQADD